jgi:putative nucleotidyltransferase with HDIG domain
MRFFLYCVAIACVCVAVAVLLSQLVSVVKGVGLLASTLCGIGAGFVMALLLNTLFWRSFRKKLRSIEDNILNCIRKGEMPSQDYEKDELYGLCKRVCEVLFQLNFERQKRENSERKLGQFKDILVRLQRVGGDLEVLLRQLKWMAGATGCAVLSYDPEGDVFRVRYEEGAHHISNGIEKGIVGDSIWRVFLSRSEPMIIRRGLSDRLSAPLLSAPLPYDLILTPIRVGNRFYGIVALAKDDGSFSHDEYEVAVMGAQLLSLVVHTSQLHERLTSAFIDTVAALAEAIDAKDPYTRHHSKCVTQWAVLFGRWLNLQPQQIDNLHVGGLMHDLGKIAVPDDVLRKPQALTPEEFELIKLHPVKGAEILSRVSLPWDVIPIVLHHHERWDGKGYPYGLRGEEIPLLARLVAIVDAFDAMISDRAYRSALPIDEALKRVISEAGKQFDPTLATSFVQFASQNMDVFVDRAGSSNSRS